MRYLERAKERSAVAIVLGLEAVMNIKSRVAGFVAVSSMPARGPGKNLLPGWRARFAGRNFSGAHRSMLCE